VGEAYLPDVSAAFANLRAATVELLRPRRGRVLMVSTTPTLAAKWLVPRLASFRAAYPGIDVRINTSMRWWISRTRIWTWRSAMAAVPGQGCELTS
jgi:LysR family glycine cleavage system transcriptional activator